MIPSLPFVVFGRRYRPLLVYSGNVEGSGNLSVMAWIASYGKNGIYPGQWQGADEVPAEDILPMVNAGNWCPQEVAEAHHADLDILARGDTERKEAGARQRLRGA